MMRNPKSEIWPFLLLFLALTLVGCGRPKPAELPADLPQRFDDQRAWRDLERVVAFGPRPSGSEALAHTAAYIVSQLSTTTLHVEQQNFSTNTPRGTIKFRNIIARTRPDCPPRFILAGHYDTKWLPKIKFVGANDAGSSTAVLLELARVLDKQPIDAWLVWFDGEEAVKEYNETDGLFGSRYLAKQLFDQKKLAQVQGMILVDMVGDKNFCLTLPKPYPLEQKLTAMAIEAAAAHGLRDYVTLSPNPIIDDHYYFLLNQIPAVDLIDFDYGNLPGRNNFWQTERDTIDKCAP